MRNRFLSYLLLLSFLISLGSPVQAQAPAGGDEVALLAVEIRSESDLARFEASGLPAYARLQGRQPLDYLLTGADPSEQAALLLVGLSYQVLDADIAGASYYLVTFMAGGSPDQVELSDYGKVLLDDGVQVVLRADPAQAESLVQAGAELRRLTFDPKPLRQAAAPLAIPDSIDPDPLIQSMIYQVDSETVDDYTAGLTGDRQVWVGGEWYTITSRWTYSGEPIQKATQWTGEHFAELGLEVEYHQWNAPTNPNVIGELPGLINPEDIFIIGGHLDAVNGSPGADDNGSGSVATMIAAEILSQYEWACTLRFALWTGEEQGLLGSAAYAQRASSWGENILGYLNLDMISYSTVGSPPDIDLIYHPNMPPTQQFAQLFADVIDSYDLNLIPELHTSLGGGSDHQSFWTYGYTAILAIEDQGDFNPYYHSPSDTRANQNLPYYTEFVKAALGTFAHLTDCLIPSGIGTLEGTVSADNGGVPVEGALVTAENDAGHTLSALTDADGFYTRTLLEDTYTVTAAAYGYLPSTVTGVAILEDTVTTLDFALQDAPHYTVSGTVTAAGSGIPLYAQVVFEGSPVSVWSDPSTGFYSAQLPQGEYTMHVTAPMYAPESREIVLDGDRTEDFVLNPLPCVLLVDDDNNAPNVLPYYTSALNSLGIDYDVFDVGGGSANGPPLEGLQGYAMVIWFSGDKYGNSAGPNSTDEDNLAAYLDSGGRLFLSSQDYLYDFGLTAFGQDYLGIGSFTNDSGNAATKYGVAGDPIGDGLGPYPLTYPSGFTDWGDIVNAGPGASVSFTSAPGGGNNLDISKDGGSWKTVFFGTSWVPVQNASPANGEELLGRIVEWFGGCEFYGVALSGDDSQVGIPGETITYTLSVTNVGTLTDNFDLSLGAVDFPTSLETDQVGPLEAGATAEFQVFVEIPQDALPGEMDAVEVTATSQGDSLKWASATLTTTVGGIYGVELSGDDAQEGIPGETITYTLSVTNVSDLWTDTFDLSLGDAEFPTSLETDQVGPLDPGATAEFQVFVEIPQDALPGEMDAVEVTATSQGDSLKWASATLTTTVGGSYGVLLDSDQTEAAGPPAGSVTYTVTLTNSGSLQDTILLSYHDVRPDWEVLLDQDSFDLAGGESVETSLQVFIPAEAQQGDWDTFTLEAVSIHDPAQQDEIEFTTTVIVLCIPPAAVDFLWSPLDPRAGDTLTFVASAAGSPPLSYEWDFGDGSSAAGEQVLHIYTHAAEYTVTLTVKNACGEASTSHTLTIAPSATHLYLPLIVSNGQ
ncbi:MAG: M28 family peptidase [Anaerolineales bacterium]